MEHILIIGLSHKTADIQTRECFAFSKEENSDAIKKISSFPHINGLVIISTCNRMEIIVITNDIEKSKEHINNFFVKYKNIAKEKFEKSLYYYEDKKAIKHIFCVAGSLDSMIIGEPQILGQVKESYQNSVGEKCTSVILNKLFHIAFTTAKKIRTQTKIGNSAVSVSYAAIELAKKIFGSIENREVLLIGAGEMAEIAVRHIIGNKIKTLFVANRTFERAVKLANEFSGVPIKFEEIEEVIEKKIDIVISSTASSGFILTKSKVKEIMKERRSAPIFFIDIALPRDIDPEVNKLDGAYVFDIDDLKDVIEENLEERKKETIKAERIVEEAVINFSKWLGTLDLVPTIVDLKNKIDAIVNKEFLKTLSNGNFSEKEKNSINLMLEAVKNKILHNPIIFMKELSSSHRDKKKYLNTIRDIFDLD